MLDILKGILYIGDSYYYGYFGGGTLPKACRIPPLSSLGGI